MRIYLIDLRKLTDYVASPKSAKVLYRDSTRALLALPTFNHRFGMEGICSIHICI